MFILIKDTIEHVEGAFSNFKTDCEIVWAQVNLPGSKLLNICSVYRPPNAKIDYMHKLQDHMNQVFSKYRNATYISGGDMNLSCIDWVKDTVQPMNKGSTNDTHHCSIFLETMQDLGLSQHCLEITRMASQKTLDLMLTNRPSSVLEVQSLPGMSDHNIVLTKFKLLITRSKVPQRRIFKYDKADWEQVRKATK